MGTASSISFGLGTGLAGPLDSYDIPWGSLTLEEQVAALSPAAWFDATETYAKSKIAVDLVGGDYLINTATSYNFGSNDFSVSFWFKLGSTTGFNALADFRQSTTTEDRIALANNGANGLGIYLQGAYIVDSGSQLNPNQWYHACFQKRSGTYYIYIDGSNVASVANSVTLLDSPLVVGNLYSFGNPMGGDMDQMVIVNGYGEEDLVTELYNSGSGLNHKDLDGTETFYNNIVAWYDFNVPKNFGRNYAEESHAVALDGSADKFQITGLTSSNGLIPQIGDGFSWGGWFYINATASNQEIISNYNGNYGVRFRINVGGTILVQLIDNVSTISAYTTTGTVTAGAWNHIVLTHDGTNTAQGVTVYFNGVADGATGSATAVSTITNGAHTFYITGGAFNQFIAGKVDEAFAYQDKLTAGEVSTLYNGGTVAEASTLHTDNLVSSWSFNEQDPALVGQDVYGTNDLTPVSIVEADLVGGKDSLDLTEVSISSSNAVLGHIEGKAAGFDGLTRWTDKGTGGLDATESILSNLPFYDLANKAVVFDGVSDEITVGSSTGSFNFLHDGSGGTFCVYCRPAGASPSNNNVIFDNGGYSSNKVGVKLMIDTTDDLRYQVNRGVAGQAVGVNVTDVSSVLDGSTWLKIFISFSSDGSTTNDWEIYCNAISDTYSTSTYFPSVTDASFDAIIGTTNATTPTEYFEGEIRSIIPIPKVLSASERQLVSDYWDEVWS